MNGLVVVVSLLLLLLTSGTPMLPPSLLNATASSSTALMKMGSTWDLKCDVCKKAMDEFKGLVAKEGCGVADTAAAAACEAAGFGPEDPFADACVAAFIGGCEYIAKQLENDVESSNVLCADIGFCPFSCGMFCGGGNNQDKCHFIDMTQYSAWSPYVYSFSYPYQFRIKISLDTHKLKNCGPVGVNMYLLSEAQYNGNGGVPPFDNFYPHESYTGTDGCPCLSGHGWSGNKLPAGKYYITISPRPNIDTCGGMLPLGVDMLNIDCNTICKNGINPDKCSSIDMSLYSAANPFVKQFTVENSFKIKIGLDTRPLNNCGPGVNLYYRNDDTGKQYSAESHTHGAPCLSGSGWSGEQFPPGTYSLTVAPQADSTDCSGTISLGVETSTPIVTPAPWTPAPPPPTPLPTPPPPPLPTPLPPASDPCSVKNSAGEMIDLANIAATTLSMDQVYNGQASGYLWSISLCKPISTPPSGTQPCPQPGYITEYNPPSSSPGCQTSWYESAMKWQWSAEHNAAFGSFLNSKGWTANVFVGCGATTALASKGAVDVTGSEGLTFTFQLTSSVACGSSPAPTPSSNDASKSSLTSSGFAPKYDSHDESNNRLKVKFIIVAAAVQGVALIIGGIAFVVHRRRKMDAEEEASMTDERNHHDHDDGNNHDLGEGLIENESRSSAVVLASPFTPANHNNVPTHRVAVSANELYESSSV